MDVTIAVYTSQIHALHQQLFNLSLTEALAYHWLLTLQLLPCVIHEFFTSRGESETL